VIDYRTPVADILFALRHGAEADRLPDWDDGLAGEVVRAAGRFVDAEIAPLDPIADAEPARLVDGRVRLPEAFVAAYRRFCAAGWPGIVADPAYGGQGLPHVLGSVVSELLAGACITFQMILSLGQGSARTIAAHGSDEQKRRYLPRLASGEWLATMCLTEPEAGSDLGRIRTVAEPAADGSFRIRGGKIFISGGDQNMTHNIVHLVLARLRGAPAGVRGLSLFVCPAVADDGVRNAVAVVRLEDKMGMHASPTCQLAFDGATAELLGAEGEGLARMFTMMNAERLDVAVEAIGLAEVAAQRALHHAAERRQGRAPGSAEPVDPIRRHGDVQRMLLTLMALVHGMRAMTLRTAVDLERDAASPLAAFLTPVCKAFCTDAAVEAANLAIQVLGGYGYLREYRVEQNLRDARITPIYEGTNGIQAMTLAGRLLHSDNGAAAEAFAAEIEDAGRRAAKPFATALAGALDHWRRATAAVRANPDPGMVAASYLRLSGLIAFAAGWSRMETAAAASPHPVRIRALAAFVRDWMLAEAALLSGRVHNPPEPCADAVFVDG
jgi:hypothetical protein